ncbi:MAG: CPBP family glutamic-type intramembrane protease [Caulobacteraceae bacterium]
MNSSSPSKLSDVQRNQHRPAAFYVLALVLSVPFLVLGGASRTFLLPGLPIAALMAVCPGIAATILVWRDGGWTGVTVLLSRAFDARRVRKAAWYLPILLFAPLQYALAFGVLRLSGLSLPAPNLDPAKVGPLCLLFFAGAVAEELGWTGYATEPLIERWGVVKAGLILGAGWAAFHFVALAEAHRSASWIAWWTLWTMGIRVAMVCLFNASGRSVFAIALFHMLINVGWQLFPIDGSYFDPRVSGLVCAAMATITVWLWGHSRPRPSYRT